MTPNLDLTIKLETMLHEIAKKNQISNNFESYVIYKRQLLPLLLELIKKERKEYAKELSSRRDKDIINVFIEVIDSIEATISKSLPQDSEISTKSIFECIRNIYPMIYKIYSANVYLDPYIIEGKNAII